MTGVYRKIIQTGVVALITMATTTGAGSEEQVREESSAMPRDVSLYTDFDDSAYHLYARDINWEEPVGIVYYFSGDYFRRSESELFHPRGETMESLAEEAAARNMILVAPMTPSERGYEGFTWWENGDENAEWFRELHEVMNTSYDLAPDKIWFMGYSGGAEFIAQEILADFRTSFGAGGALMVGGGGPPAELIRSPEAVQDRLRLMWMVGDEDTAGSTNPPDWSALEAARSGEEFYRERGFSRTYLDIVEDTDHLDYDLDEALDEHFDYFAIPRTNTQALTTALSWTSLGAAITGGLGGFFGWRHNRKRKNGQQ